MVQGIVLHTYTAYPYVFSTSTFSCPFPILTLHLKIDETLLVDAHPVAIKPFGSG